MLPLLESKAMTCRLEFRISSVTVMLILAFMGITLSALLLSCVSVLKRTLLGLVRASLLYFMTSSDDSDDEVRRYNDDDS